MNTLCPIGYPCLCYLCTHHFIMFLDVTTMYSDKCFVSIRCCFKTGILSYNAFYNFTKMISYYNIVYTHIYILLVFSRTNLRRFTIIFVPNLVAKYNLQFSLFIRNFGTCTFITFTHI